MSDTNSKRFAVIADIHVGLIGLQPDGRTYGDAAPMLKRAVDRLRATDGVEELILLGDLVNRGHRDEYDRINSILAPVYPKVIPVIGNHELQRASKADFESAMGVPHFRRSTVAGITSLLLCSGIENLPDSEWHGEITPDQLALIDETVDQLTDQPLFVFTHHPLAGTVRGSDTPMHFLTNSDEVLRRLDRHQGPTVIFSGHNHAASIVRDGRRLFVGVPSIGFWPHAYAIVNVDDSRLSLSTQRVWTDPSSSPDARARDDAHRAWNEGTAPEQSVNFALSV